MTPCSPDTGDWTTRVFLIAERAALLIGLVFIATACLAWIDGRAEGRTAVRDFEQIARAVVTPAEQEDWSPDRIAKYAQSVERDAGDTLAVLRIPATGIEVAVFDTTGTVALNRGAGLVEGSSPPDANGNIAIAGHRDGFFRGLKDIEIGDDIELKTLLGTRHFRVTEVDIVDPLDVSVLDPTDHATVTLITCYPFYYVGHAPERFIVRAAIQQQGAN